MGNHPKHYIKLNETYTSEEYEKPTNRWGDGEGAEWGKHRRSQKQWNVKEHYYVFATGNEARVVSVAVKCEYDLSILVHGVISQKKTEKAQEITTFFNIANSQKVSKCPILDPFSFRILKKCPTLDPFFAKSLVAEKAIFFWFSGFKCPILDPFFWKCPILNPF